MHKGAYMQLLAIVCLVLRQYPAMNAGAYPAGRASEPAGINMQSVIKREHFMSASHIQLQRADGTAIEWNALYNSEPYVFQVIELLQGQFGHYQAFEHKDLAVIVHLSQVPVAVVAEVRLLKVIRRSLCALIVIDRYRRCNFERRLCARGGGQKH